MEELEKFITRFGRESEEYRFYDNEVVLRYYDDEHAYYLLGTDGSEERQDGVTTVVHIIDKSNALVPWSAKMVVEKALRTVPGTRTNGVTIMSDVELEKWLIEAKSAHKEKLEDAGKTGHIAHNHIEQYVKLVILGEIHLAAALRTILPYDERAAKACQAAFSWMDRHNVRWILTEKKIYSRKYKYAGTMDGLCVCDSCDDPKCCPNPFTDRLTVADWKTSNYLYLEYLLQTAAYENAYEEEYEVDIQDRWVIRLGKEDGEFEAWHVEGHLFAKHFGGFIEALDLTRTVADIEKDLKERKDNLRLVLKAEKDEQKAAKALVETAAKAERKLERERLRLEARTAKESAKEDAKAAKQAAKWKSKDIPSQDIALLEDILRRRSET
jgi:hypothetical protein